MGERCVSEGYLSFAAAFPSEADRPLGRRCLIFCNFGVPSPSSIKMLLISLWMMPERPRANGRERFITLPLLTVTVLTNRSSARRPPLRALATAESKSFVIAGEDFL